MREERGGKLKRMRGKGVVPLDAAAWLRGRGRGAARLLLSWRVGFWFGFGERGGRGGGGAFLGRGGGMVWWDVGGMRCGGVGCEMREGDGERGKREFGRVWIVRGEERIGEERRGRGWL